MFFYMIIKQGEKLCVFYQTVYYIKIESKLQAQA